MRKRYRVAKILIGVARMNNLLVNAGVTASFNIELNCGKGTGARFLTPY